MRVQILIGLLIACTIAAGVGHAWLDRGENSIQPTETIGADSARQRLFLTEAQSRRAAADGLLPEGTRSILEIKKQLRYGQFVWNAQDVAAGPLAIRVDLPRQLISVFRGGHEIATSVILYGARDHETPSGLFPILAKSETHRSTTYDAPMPYSLWLTNDGVAIHASEIRGGAATHGCVGVPLEFARKLFEEAKVGDIVEIIGEKADPAPGA